MLRSKEGLSKHLTVSVDERTDVGRVEASDVAIVAEEADEDGGGMIVVYHLNQSAIQ